MPTPSLAHKSLVSTQSLNLNDCEAFLTRAELLKSLYVNSGQIWSDSLRLRETQRNLVVALVFLESSTRTRFSFEIAAKRLGLKTVVFSAGASTSMAKGETEAETLRTLLSMHPDMLVIRYSGDTEVQKIVQQLVTGRKTPVINAGDGSGEHPTQALLDVMTIRQRLGEIANQRVLYVGDVEHSRVARSGRTLLELMGAEVAICAPSALMPKSSDWANVKRFSNLDEALKWCTVCNGLRIQFERHGAKFKISKDEYIEKFRLDEKNLKALSQESVILHPGPFVSGVDLDEAILLDKRCGIREQVENGVFIRMAVMGECFGLFDT